MGNICAAPQYTKQVGAARLSWPSTAKVVHPDGKLQEYKQPIKASRVLLQNPDCFLCSSDSMYVNCHPPPVPGDEELQLGQIYFLVPLSKSRAPLSLQELCALAIKASAALADHGDGHHGQSNVVVRYASSKKGSKIPVAGGHRRRSKIPVGFDVDFVNFPAGGPGQYTKATKSIEI